MSRAQETTATNTAAAQGSTYFNNSQNSYAQAAQDAGNFEKQVGAYAAGNPFVQGGQDQKVTNQQLTNTADASAQAAGQALQSQALRTGQNAAGGVAATEAMQQQNERNLSGQEASATQQRIGSEAAYNKSALDASGQAQQMEASLSGQQAQAAEGALGNQVKAASTPSWTDEFGNAVASTLAKGAGVGLQG